MVGWPRQGNPVEVRLRSSTGAAALDDHRDPRNREPLFCVFTTLRFENLADCIGPCGASMMAPPPLCPAPALPSLISQLIARFRRFQFHCLMTGPMSSPTSLPALLPSPTFRGLFSLFPRADYRRPRGRLAHLRSSSGPGSFYESFHGCQLKRGHFPFIM